jgi:mannose-6-phosphate isomerase-like protein (cupin superfamily)
MMRRCLVAGMVAGLSLVVPFSTAGQARTNSTPSAVTVQTLAQGPLQELPAGKIFVGVLEFSQVPGAACGPTCYWTGIVYTLHGVATISIPGSAATSVSPGEAAFTSPLAAHTNADGRAGAGAIAIGLILVLVLLCAATWLRGGRRRVVIAVLSLSLIAGSTLPLIGATSNEWYFFAVRPVSHRASPMIRADGRVVLSSPDLDRVPSAPYTETLSAITVPPGARYDALAVPGPEMVVVVEGTAAVHVDDQATQLGVGAAAFAQTGQTLAIVNSGSDTLQVLDFAVASRSAAPAAT